MCFERRWGLPWRFILLYKMPPSLYKSQCKDALGFPTRAWQVVRSHSTIANAQKTGSYPRIFTDRKVILTGMPCSCKQNACPLSRGWQYVHARINDFLLLSSWHWQGAKIVKEHHKLYFLKQLSRHMHWGMLTSSMAPEINDSSPQTCNTPMDYSWHTNHRKLVENCWCVSMVYMIPFLLSSQQLCEVSDAERQWQAQSHLGSFLAEKGFVPGFSMCLSNTRTSTLP